MRIILAAIILAFMLSGCSDDKPVEKDFVYISSASDPAADINIEAVELLKNKKMNEAALLFKQAAEKGNRSAQYFLGLLYARGDGLKQDYQLAYQWLHKAGMGGHPKAMYHLGEMNVRGEGTQESVIKAQMWFWLGTTAGDRFSEKRLRAITPRLSAEEMSVAVSQSKAMWKAMPHDLKVELFSMH